LRANSCESELEAVLSQNLMRSRTQLLAFLTALLAAVLPVSAHVGSPDVFYEGNAGPYRLVVTVRVPQVIPGVAEIQIRSESGDVRAIRVVPLRLAGPGSNLPPTPDLAQRSNDDPQFFAASLWLMESGALQVRVLVDGVQGRGELSVPVPASAQRTLPMEKPLAGLLLALLLFLAVGVISIVGAIAREGNLEAGEIPDRSHQHRASIVMPQPQFLSAPSFIWKAWWGSDATGFNAGWISSCPSRRASAR
jgi:hypothetical protein